MVEKSEKIGWMALEKTNGEFTKQHQPLLKYYLT